jgi:hypothetical protein
MPLVTAPSWQTLAAAGDAIAWPYVEPVHDPAAAPSDLEQPSSSAWRGQKKLEPAWWSQVRFD